MLFPKLTFWSVFLLGFFGSPDVAWASDGILGSDTTRIWLITCTLLVFLMQVGFLLLEAGATRSKNAINASFKNKSDLIISVLAFLLLGHVLVFGPTVGGYFGFGLPRIADWSPDEIIVMLYFAGFCATAATILSGAVCERFSLKAYLPTVCFIALIVAPIPMHWVSGADLISGNTPFLVGLGFIDFAGATIIHGTGAWIALAALIAVGPRLGRFDPKTGKPRYVEGYSSILSMAGALLLLIGWVGFNGGAALSFDENVSLVVLKTLFAGFFGGFVGLAICFLLKWKLHPVRLIESTIAGLVAVTAAPHLFSFAFVLVLVCVAVGVSFFVRSLLLKMGVDDVVNVVATHGFAGVIGTLAVTFAVPIENLVSGSRFAQLGVQSAGVLAVFVWSFSVAFIWFKLLNRVIPLRVERRAEQVGLNRSSHGALFSKDLFAQELENLLKSGDIYHTRLNLPEGDENYRLSRLFNRIMEDLRSARENENSERELREAQERELRLQAETAQVRAEEAANAMRSKEQAQRELRESAERSERAASEELLRKTQDAEAVSVCLQRAMKGDLEAEVTTSCASPEFEEIRIGVNALISTLSRNIGKIASSANEVTQRCDALTGISEVLNRRSADQIDSVQAITIKLGQMGESAEENRVMANDALEAARVSRDVSDTVTANLDNVTGAMDTIIDRTSKIEPIVDLIEEIAFQTTLLALNASVEAARAGEAGTGFKVVASEVRGLANRVQAHATDIRNIVDEASVAVSNGANTVSHTSLSIAQISKTSLNVSSQIEEIHESTSVLRQQLFDLGKVVEDITEVASSNAHMAADAADGASALAALSALLLTGIELFNGYELVAETENDDAFQAVEVNNDEAGMVFF